MQTPNPLSWEDLRLLLVVDRAGSLNAASQILGVSQPTVTRRLQRFESDLGEALFDRTPTGLRPTQVSRGLLERARAMEVHAIEARLLVVEQLSGVSDVRVSLPEQLAIDVVAPSLAAFHRKHPRVRVQLHGSPSPSDLARREADIAVRLFRPTTGALQVQKVCRMDFGVYGCAGLQRASSASSPQFVDWTDDLSHLPDSQWLRATIPAALIVARCSSLATRLAAVRGGIGLGVFATSLAENCPDLVQLPQFAPPPLDLWIVVHEDLAAREPINAVRSFLVHTLQASLRSSAVGRHPT